MGASTEGLFFLSSLTPLAALHLLFNDIADQVTSNKSTLFVYAAAIAIWFDIIIKLVLLLYSYFDYT
jgi:hypothetical protein